MALGEHRVKPFRRQGKRFEFVISDVQWQRNNRHINRAPAKFLEKQWSDLFGDGDPRLWILPRKRGKHRWEEVGSDGWDHTHAEQARNRGLSLNDIAAGRFQVAKNRPCARKKCCSKFRQPNCSAETIEKPRS